MKYANSLKYINSFAKAESLSDLSLKRVRELCAALGRINVGARHIVVPWGSAGHASAVLLESVIKCAGYRVGRITADADFDSRLTLYLDGEIAEIEDYNKCVAELKSTIIKTPDEQYFRQELVFVLSLLLCKLYGCEFIILEGLSNEYFSLDSVCAPYDLVIVPTVYAGESDNTLKTACDAVRRGVREVISGNQKSSVYSVLSNACMLSGVRLSVTAKPTFSVGEVNSRRIAFSYAERDGYMLRSPSYVLRDCAMLVIESALALRRDGVKMPWGSIARGLETSVGTGCFDIISISPAVIVDSASSKEEISLMLQTFDETVERAESLLLCLPYDATRLEDQLSALDGRSIETLILFGADEGAISGLDMKGTRVIACDSVHDAAQCMHSAAKQSATVFCIGSIGFTREIKTEFIKLMGL